LIFFFSLPFQSWFPWLSWRSFQLHCIALRRIACLCTYLAIRRFFFLLVFFFFFFLFGVCVLCWRMEIEMEMETRMERKRKRKWKKWRNGNGQLTTNQDSNPKIKDFLIWGVFFGEREWDLSFCKVHLLWSTFYGPCACDEELVMRNLCSVAERRRDETRREEKRRDEETGNGGEMLDGPMHGSRKSLGALHCTVPTGTNIELWLGLLVIVMHGGLWSCPVLSMSCPVLSCPVLIVDK